jgi:hypothetical protein
MYKLDFYLYVRTNDDSKEFISLIPNENYMFSNVNTNGFDEHQKYTMGLMMLDKLYKYKGFSIIHSTNFDHTSIHDIDEYINNIYTILGKSVVYINEERLDLDEFIEVGCRQGREVRASRPIRSKPPALKNLQRGLPARRGTSKSAHTK